MIKLRMKIHHILFFCFVSALCGGNAGLVDADTITKTEGQSAIINCQVSFPGKQKFFCKAECKREDVLIETTANSADNHKYSIEYQETSVTSGVLYVIIRQLVKSDTGWYGCGTNSGVINKHVVYLNVVKDAVATTSTSTGSTPETPPGSLEQGYFILILIVCASVFALLLVVVLLLLLYKLKMKRSSADLNTRGNPNAGDKKISTDETCPPVSTCEDSVYQSLDLASRDQAQIYSTLTCTPHTYCNKPLQ